MWKIGHRGAAGHAPENTLASFRKALALGVDGVELDVHVCGSGDAVVIHDATLDRTTNAKGPIARLSRQELNAVDAGQGERVPTLEDVLEHLAGRVTAYIELKEDAALRPVADLVARFAEKEGWGYEKLVVFSFDHPQLMRLRKTNGRILTGASLVGIPVDYAACAKRAGAWSINPCIDHLDAAFVEDAHARGLKVLTWTANQPAQIAKARAFGADGIISDYPDRL